MKDPEDDENDDECELAAVVGLFVLLAGLCVIGKIAFVLLYW